MRLDKRFSILLIISLAFVLAACSGQRAPASLQLPAATLSQPADLFLPTSTVTAPAPTLTALPASSPTPAPPPTTPPTPAPTADLALAQVKLVGVSWLENYNFLLIFQFPGPVEAKNYRATLETKEYSCQGVAQYPDRLFCTGPGAAVESMAWVRLYQAGSDQPGFERYTWIPYFTIEHK